MRLQDYFTEHLFEDCAKQFREDRLPGGASNFQHTGHDREATEHSSISPYTHAILVVSNSAIQESLNADFFLSLNPQTKIKVLAVRSPHWDDRNCAAFDRIKKCLESRYELEDGQLELCQDKAAELAAPTPEERG